MSAHVLESRDGFRYVASVSMRALNEIEAKALLAESGLPVAPAELARTAGEAARTAERIGFPAALKIVSPDIVHKSDVGGVKLGLTSPQEVVAAFEAVMESARVAAPAARLDGVAVQPMARAGGAEVIVGVSVDAQFGHVIMCGLGGVLVEVLQDVSFRLIPLQRRDARQMLSELRGRRLLEGMRGRPAVDMEALVELFLQVSGLIERRPDIRELDLNPVLAYPDGVLAVDARVLLEEPP
jgi:acyl-CoA synthetase (NDP forming)